MDENADPVRPEPIVEKGRHRFTKAMRLCKGAEFQWVFSQKTSVSDKKLVLYLRSNALSHHRIGLCISKKVTKTAPNRNLWKRMLREAFRLDHKSWPGSFDFVLLARTLLPPTLAELRQALLRLVKRGLNHPQLGNRPYRDETRKKVAAPPSSPAQNPSKDNP